MKDPFDTCILATRKLLYKENMHLKQLISEDNSRGYIQFKKGKIYGLELMVDQLLREKRDYYGRKAQTHS